MATLPLILASTLKRIFVLIGLEASVAFCLIAGNSQFKNSHEIINNTASQNLLEKSEGYGKDMEEITSVEILSKKNKVEKIDNGNHILTLKCGKITIDSCYNISVVDGTDRYISYEKDDKIFIFDTKTGISHHLKHELSSENIKFLKELPQGPIFKGNNVFGLDNFEIGIADDGEIDVYSSRAGNYLYITTPLGLGKIEYKKLRNGTELYIDPKERIHFAHSIWTKGISPMFHPCNIEFSVPIVQNNPLLRQNILYWISENILNELINETDRGVYTEKTAYTPYLFSTEEDMVNYYVDLILQKLYKLYPDSWDDPEIDTTELFSPLWGGGMYVIVTPLMENVELVTLKGTVDSNLGGGSGGGNCVIPIATFDKQSGTRITIKDIIKEDCLSEFAIYLRKIIEEKLENSTKYFDEVTLLSLPIGILHDGLLIISSRHSGISAREEEMYIPFSDIKNWLTIKLPSREREIMNPSFVREIHCRSFEPKLWNDDYNYNLIESETIDYDESECFDLYDNSTLSTHNYFNYLDSLRSKHKPIINAHPDSLNSQFNINRGYNRISAEMSMQNEEYDSAYNIYKILCEKYGNINPLGAISESYSGILSSGIKYAENLINENNFDEASLIIEEISRINSGYDFDFITKAGLVPNIDIKILRSRLQGRKNILDSAINLSKEAFPHLKSYLKNEFLSLPNKRRADVWHHYSNWCLNYLPSLAVITSDSLLKAYSYESALIGKGLLLNADIAIRKSILGGSDPVAFKLLLRNDALSTELLKLCSSIDENKKDEIENRKKEIQKNNSDLSSRSSYFEKNLQNFEVSMDDIVNSLEDKEVAIEFICVESADLNIKPSYYAMVLCKGASFPELIFLGECDVIDSLVTAGNIYESKDFFNKIWLPILPLIENASCVYFSPDRILYTTAIEYLPYKDDGTTISDVIPMKRLSSTRMIPFLKKEEMRESGEKHGVGILYGGIDYDNVPNEKNSFHDEIKSIRDVSHTPSKDYSEFRTAFNRLLTTSIIKPLIGTKEEVIGIKPFADNIRGLDDVILITGRDATEESFKNIAALQPVLLHIATHGFFFKEKDLERTSIQGLIKSITVSDSDIDDAGLLRSGLIMAGANNTIQENSNLIGLDDGILTAKEISMLNLLDVDIAILSACQTGLGELDSDGVVGLQRGFKKAGVTSLVMSLWKVDDNATKLLMIEFYRHLSATGNITASMREAQKFLRSYDHGVYNHPNYWAAFILLDAL